MPLELLYIYYSSNGYQKLMTMPPLPFRYWCSHEVLYSRITNSNVA